MNKMKILALSILIGVTGITQAEEISKEAQRLRDQWKQLETGDIPLNQVTSTRWVKDPATRDR